MTKTERYIPVYATVLAIVLALPTCLLSLLFLLITKQAITGYTQVTVYRGNDHHQTIIPASLDMTFEKLNEVVSLLRVLSAD